MHVAHGGADLRVAVGAEIFHQEIDQTAVALQQRQHLDRAVGASLTDCGAASGRFRRGGDPAAPPAAVP